MHQSDEFEIPDGWRGFRIFYNRAQYIERSTITTTTTTHYLYIRYIGCLYNVISVLLFSVLFFIKQSSTCFCFSLRFSFFFLLPWLADQYVASEAELLLPHIFSTTSSSRRQEVSVTIINTLPVNRPPFLTPIYLHTDVHLIYKLIRNYFEIQSILPGVWLWKTFCERCRNWVDKIGF